ncbi:MAG: hypothetical protein U0836_21025 [Pirellulales bacterium]
MSSSRSRMLFRALLVVIGLGLVCLLLLFLLGLLLAPQGSRGGRPVITISPETTRLTEPLRPDGYVDYLGAVNAELSQGVTPENNAAVELLYAMGPGSIGSSIRREYFQRLGIAIPPEQGAYVRPLKDFETIGQPPPPTEEPSENSADEAVAEATEDADIADEEVYELAPPDEPKRPSLTDEQTLAQQRPWTPEELPRIAAWLTANEIPLAHIRAATERPRWYTPMVSADGLLMTVLLPQTQDSREAARLLLARAMLRLGEGDAEAAWQDLLACHRLGRLVGQGPTMVERLVGYALDNLAGEGDRALALHGKLPAARLVEMQAELAKLPPIAPMADSADAFERYSFLSTTAMAARDGPLIVQQLLDQPSGNDNLLVRSLGGLAHTATDWDVPLRMGNEYFDRLVAAAREPNPQTRAVQLAELESDLRGARDGVVAAPELTDLFHPREEMGQRMGRLLVASFLPGVEGALNAEQRGAALISLTRLAMSLAAYHADHGAYPEQLGELAPKYIDSVPTDPGSGGAFHYRRTNDGYVLHGVGPNRLDEQGRGASDQPPGDDLRISAPLETK